MSSEKKDKGILIETSDNNKYGRGTFSAPARYVAYMNMSADSPVYKGLPGIRGENGKINWQCSSGKTTSFYKFFPGRFDWWVQKADDLELPGTGNSDDRLTIAARTIHPTGKKVCLVCGKERYIGYMYINANFANALNKVVGEQLFEKTMPVYEAVKILVEKRGKEFSREFILKNFPEKADDIALFDAGNYEEFFRLTQQIRSTKLSPGYMGDCPHRLDGIHDYCTFCRKRNDPGRSDENMCTYNHDRRAFMWWAEGDWKIADTLYNSAGPGVCVNCGKHVKKISPDHVGPLACGFKQNGFFDPLCGRCNSAKNRRFTFDNVISLLDYEEKTGESAASWQVRALWDKTKDEMRDDATVKTLSNYMRAMQDYYLRILSYIASLGHFEYLTCYLHPEYANYNVTFTGLDPSTLSYKSFNKVKAVSNGSRSLAARSVRIAFEELFEYCSKPTAKRKSIILKTVEAFLLQDKAKISKIFSSVPVNEVDKKMQAVLSPSIESLDQKDSEIQVIIESADFTNRMGKYAQLTNQLKSIIDSRGLQFADECIAEIAK